MHERAIIQCTLLHELTFVNLRNSACRAPLVNVVLQGGVVPAFCSAHSQPRHTIHSRNETKLKRCAAALGRQHGVDDAVLVERSLACSKIINSLRGSSDGGGGGGGGGLRLFK